MKYATQFDKHVGTAKRLLGAMAPAAGAVAGLAGGPAGAAVGGAVGTAVGALTKGLDTYDSLKTHAMRYGQKAQAALNY